MCCIVQARKAFYDNKEDLLQLWVHETFRVVGDRMFDPADLAWLRKQVDERLSSAFSTNFANLFEDFNEEVCTCGDRRGTGWWWGFVQPQHVQTQQTRKCWLVRHQVDSDWPSMPD
jgi:hypothetical protein